MYSMIEGVMSKINNELRTLRDLRKEGLFIAFGFGAQLLAIVLRKIDLPGEILFDLGSLIGFLGWAGIFWGTVGYANAKGRGSYLALLGSLGFLIVFLVNAKTGFKKAESPGNPLKFVDIILIVILAFSLFSFTQLFIFRRVYEIGADGNLFQHRFFIISFPTVLFVPIWSLIRNRRRIVPTASWICLTLFLVWFLSIPNHAEVLEAYKIMRLWFYLYLVLYIISHLVINGLSWLKHKERKVVTPTGVFELYLMSVFITFLHAIYDLLARIISRLTL